MLFESVQAQSEAEAKVRAEVMASSKKAAINKMPKLAFREREDESCPHTPRSDVLLRSLPSSPHTPRSLQEPVGKGRNLARRGIAASANAPEAPEVDSSCVGRNGGGQDVSAWLRQAEAELRAEIRGIEAEMMAQSRNEREQRLNP